MLANREYFTDPANLNTTVTIDQLQAKFPYMQWGNLLEKLFYSKQATPAATAKKARIYLRTPRYFNRVAKILNERDAKLLYIWNVVFKNSVLLPDAYQMPREKLMELLKGQKTRTDRWNECQDFAQTAGMGFVLGNEFLNRQFNDFSGTKKLVHQLMTDIRAAFRARLHGLTWLDAEDRKKTAFKVCASC